MDMKRMCGKGKGRGVYAAALQLIEKNCEMWRILLLCGASFPAKGGPAPRNSRGAWGVAPNGNARPKQGSTNKHMASWGEAPITGCRGIIPLPGFGVEPQRPPNMVLSIA